MAYLVNSDIYTTSLADGMILLAASQGQYYELNPTGQFIFERIKKGIDTNQIIQQLCDEYACSSQEASDDVSAIIADLIQSDLIKHTGSSESR